MSILGAASGFFTGSAAGDTDPYFSNVVALLHFDGNLTDQKGHTFTATGDANTSSTGKFNNGLTLDGSGDYIQSADSPDWDTGTGAFTIEVWAKPAALTQARLFVRDTGGLGEIDVLMNTSGNIRCKSNGGTVDFTTSAGSLSVGNWSHVAYVRNGSGTHEIFIDGVSRGSGSDTSAYDSTTALTVGGRPGIDSFNGMLDDFRFTKGVARYTGTFTPPTAAFPDS